MAQVQAEPPTMYKLEVQKTIIPCSKKLINHSSLIMDLLEFSIDDDYTHPTKSTPMFLIIGIAEMLT